MFIECIAISTIFVAQITDIFNVQTMVVIITVLMIIIDNDNKNNNINNGTNGVSINPIRTTFHY